MGISQVGRVISELVKQNYPITRRREPHVTPLGETVHLMTYWKTVPKGPIEWKPTKADDNN